MLQSPEGIYKLLIVAVFAASSLVISTANAEDRYEEYARWWKKRVESKPIVKNKDGSRKGYFNVQFNPTPISAEKAEESGLVRGPTFVLGVAIGDEARAWPLHAIGELQNDVVGNVPIAASW